MRGPWLLCGVLCVLLCALSWGEIPTVISYQGKVTDASGNPVADNTYTMRFRIYDDVTGGSVLWDSGAHSVSVTGGIFSVLLGESPQPAIPLDFSQNYWLLVTFNGVNQTPRQRLASAGYAYMASGLVPGTTVHGHIVEGYASSLTVINEASNADAAALYAFANAGAGYTHGVYAANNSPSGNGLFARSTSGTGLTKGVYAQVLSDEGTAIHGQAPSTSGSTVGVHGEVSSPDGIAIRGIASATTGAALGVLGNNASPNGDGVRGVSTSASGQCWGVLGISESTDGRGVVGWAPGTSGDTYGVAGESSSSLGRGVWGLASSGNGWTYGVYGQTSSSEGDGVHGSATATEGLAYGGYFETESDGGIGVYGDASALSGTTYGMYGQSASPSGTGVCGVTTQARDLSVGVSGETQSSHGIGVLGFASAYPGSTACGVQGSTNSWIGAGVVGYNSNYSASNAIGVEGGCAAPGGRGVQGYGGSTSGTAYGLYGIAGFPSGSSRVGVYYSGGLAGTGTKSCVVKTSKGPTMYYCQESPECWFEDFGDGRLSIGRAHIELDPVFLETVTISEVHPMRVFVELGGDCEGVYVERRLTGFDVKELRGGRSDVPFTYRVVAKRRDFESDRLTVCEAARTDPFLYPEYEENVRRRFLEGITRAEDHERRSDETRLLLKRGAVPDMSRIAVLRPD
ncbi:hypothetical protein JXA88_10175 [Candidatus Fermentibacteria bacterium]|nr:hypothetical protein [Candidatus Fermentibacteria bacterium]